MKQKRDDKGQFQQVVSDQEILKVFDYEDDPVLTSKEVAIGLKRFDINVTKEAIRNRLHEMEDKGLVTKKSLGLEQWDGGQMSHLK